MTNGAGQVVSVTDPLARTTTLGYAFGDLVSVETPLGHMQAESFAYDLNGNLIS